MSMIQIGQAVVDIGPASPYSAALPVNTVPETFAPSATVQTSVGTVTRVNLVGARATHWRVTVVGTEAVYVCEYTGTMPATRAAVLAAGAMLVPANQTAYLRVGKEGAKLCFVNENTDWSYAAAASGIASTTTAVTVKAAVAGLRNYVNSIQLMSEDLGTATEFCIRDGAGGTVLWRTKVVKTSPPYHNTTFNPPLRSTAGNLLEIVTLTSSGGGAVYCNMQGTTGA